MGAVRFSFESEANRAQALLTQIQSAAQSVADQTAQLDALREGAQLELERRAAALVETQNQELARRGEDAIAAWTERLQPALEAAGQETVARVGAQLEQQLGSHLERANQVLARLESESLAAEEARLKHEEVLTALAGRTIEAATAQLQKQIDLLGHDFQEAGRNTVSQWLAEIDAKATETTHATFESLFKTADWYEKKVQAQMQATLEKGVEQGVEQLREKAGEISRLFAGELDHYSRSYVEHTQGQIDETAREALERSRKQSTEMIASSVSSLARQMQTSTDAAMGDFQVKADTTLGKLSAQAEDQVAQTQAKIEAVSAHFSADFGASISQQAQQMLASARQQLTAYVDSARNTLRMESDARERHLLDELSSVSDQGVEAYKERLESTSNSWLLTTVSRLNQNSEQHLETLSRAAESRLNDICKQVFAGVGEALRRQMLDLPCQHPRPLPPKQLPRATKSPSSQIFPCASRAPHRIRIRCQQPPVIPGTRRCHPEARRPRDLLFVRYSQDVLSLLQPLPRHLRSPSETGIMRQWPIAPTSASGLRNYSEQVCSNASSVCSRPSRFRRPIQASRA